MKKIDTEYLGPATSDAYKEACIAFNKAIDAFQRAQVAELRYQIQYMNSTVRNQERSEYGITDPLSNLETLVNEMFPESVPMLIPSEQPTQIIEDFTS